jgi:hypothetical protein
MCPWKKAQKKSEKTGKKFKENRSSLLLPQALMSDS